MIFGNSAQRALLPDFLEKGPRTVCLAGDPHLGKSSFLREELPHLVSDSDLMFSDPGPDGAREARAFASTEPVHGDLRVLVVENIDAMSGGAQDAYLKLLEEPPPSLRVLVTASDTGHIQPPLLSRMRLVSRWSPLSDEDMVAFASTIDPVDDSLFPIARGRPGVYSRIHGKSAFKDLFATVSLSVTVHGDPFMDSVPEALGSLSDPDDRSVAAFVCRSAALVPGAIPGLSAHILRFCSVLSSVPSASATMHWMRAAAAMSRSLYDQRL